MIAVLAPGASAPPSGTDPTVVAARYYRVHFENERACVLTFHAAPGERWALAAFASSRRRRLARRFRGTQRGAGPPPTERKATRGDAAWIPARSHSSENVGGTDMDCVLVELKEPPARATTPGAGATRPDGMNSPNRVGVAD